MYVEEAGGMRDKTLADGSERLSAVREPRRSARLPNFSYVLI